MVSAQVTIVNKSGLHARPASVFVKETLKYKSSITIKMGDKSYNGKSILGVLGACVKCGTTFELICDGPDEKEALEGMSALVASGLGE